VPPERSIDRSSAGAVRWWAAKRRGARGGDGRAGDEPMRARCVGSESDRGVARVTLTS
jgi:hypothetical protein